MPRDRSNADIIDDLNRVTAHLSDEEVPGFLRRHVPPQPISVQEFVEVLERLDTQHRQIAELTDRLAALEDRKLIVRDLPLAALQRKLEQDWLPDACILLQPGSTAKALARDEAERR